MLWPMAADGVRGVARETLNCSCHNQIVFSDRDHTQDYCPIYLDASSEVRKAYRWTRYEHKSEGL